MGDLIDTLAAWAYSPTAGGGVYVAPDGDTIRIELVDEPGSLDGDVIVTPEGEPGMIVTTDRGVLAVVGDGPTLRIEATGDCARLRPLVDALVRCCGLGAGETRRRRFEHRGPAGWQRTRGHQQTEWSQGDACITVFDARPTARGAAESLDRYLMMRTNGIAMTEGIQRERIDVGPLSGWITMAHGRDAGGTPLTCVVAALADDRFTYVARLETRADLAAVYAFRALVSSFRPVARRPVEQSTLAWMAD